MSSALVDPECPFGQVPPSATAEAFGVDYVRIHPPGGGELFLTAFGWPFARQLMPELWYADARYKKSGQRLPGATGAVYRTKTRPINGRSVDIVVKFSRVGQEVPLEVATTFPDAITADDIVAARFNSPWEEFGLLMELRRDSAAASAPRVLTQRPLAIYAPPRQYELWQLGRSRSRFHIHEHELALDQQKADDAIAMDVRRDYLMVYSWVEGRDAVQMQKAGELTDEQLRQMTRRVVEQLRVTGFRVLDNKPSHFILRSRRTDNRLLTRHGEPAYALVDYELLGRTDEHQTHYKASQRARYLQIQSDRSLPSPARLPSHLKQTNILGVDYVFGPAPNGGRIWAVGSGADLFDYFLPDRWRRTPRVKLSLSNEVYRTRTRDNIHIAYRLSRVGQRPHVDPFYEQGRRIRQHGYNSPFEEVALAQRLRAAGIPTIYPRAIYRTGHESVRAGYLRDNLRYASHAGLTIPGDPPEPVLSDRHDYFTLWGLWRGVEPAQQYRRVGQAGFVDVEKAHDDRLIDDPTYDHIVRRTRQRLVAIGFNDQMLGDFEFLVSFDVAGNLELDAHGESVVRLSLDALTAVDYGLLAEFTYRNLIDQVQQKLASVGCEALNLSGSHLLLAIDSAGDFQLDAEGQIAVTICNFELMHMNYCRL